MITLCFYALAAIGAAAVLVSAWFVCICCWIASGEPDVNGDPERDAGGES